MTGLSRPPVSELAAFLLERIAEDEHHAKIATRGPWEAAMDGQDYGVKSPARPGLVASCNRGKASEDVYNSLHIARCDPPRVLAECEAKRRIVELAAEVLDPANWETKDNSGGLISVPIARQRMRDVLGLLAVPYGDHPDYRQEWKP
jgi:hypothetical protein